LQGRVPYFSLLLIRTYDYMVVLWCRHVCYTCSLMILPLIWSLCVLFPWIFGYGWVGRWTVRLTHPPWRGCWLVSLLSLALKRETLLFLLLFTWCVQFEWRGIFCISLHATKIKIVSFVALSGITSTNPCLFSASETSILDSFSVSLRFRRFRTIVLIVWKSPMITWFKVNTYGLLPGRHASCGDIFCDDRITFLGCFASNLGNFLVFEVELHGLVMPIEFAAEHSWNNFGWRVILVVSFKLSKFLILFLIVCTITFGALDNYFSCFFVKVIAIRIS